MHTFTKDYRSQYLKPERLGILKQTQRSHGKHQFSCRTRYRQMKSLICIISLTFWAITAFCQHDPVLQFKNFEGVWIAEDYLNSFNQTKSSIKSKKAFNPNDPVGLRINLTEIENGRLNIGYSGLHDHLLHPETSRYVVANGDTISEQGFFQINLQKSDSLNFYETTEIYYFSEEQKAYFSWSFVPDTTLILYRPAAFDEPQQTIRFKRISHTFKPDYLFPNPIYYYTRSKTLTGTYMLKDSLGHVLSTNFQIGLDGKSSGYTPFNDKIFYFSTDIYCGYESTEDVILLCKYDKKLEPDCEAFIYKRVGKRSIQLHRQIWSKADEKQIVGKMLYKLVKL